MSDDGVKLNLLGLVNRLKPLMNCCACCFSYQFGDGAGFAVPTPTVPVLSSFTAPQVSHTGEDVSQTSHKAFILLSVQQFPSICFMLMLNIHVS